MKKIVLIISKYFPSYHPEKGNDTNFISKILINKKIHTIRDNVKYWQKKIKLVQNNEAYLSLRYWSERPYHSQQVEFKKLYNSNGVGIQLINFYNGSIDNKMHVSLKLFRRENITYPLIVAENDGFESKINFENWFKLSKSDVNKPKAIIHFTDYRYNSPETFLNGKIDLKNDTMETYLIKNEGEI